MDEDLRAMLDAERKAAELDHLGPNVGAGATIWARAIQDVLPLHESARERFAANDANLEVWERFHATGLMVVSAVAQVLAFAGRVESLTHDAELLEARARFDARCPDAREIRNLAAHLDEYAVGLGRRQQPGRTGQPPSLPERNLAVLPFWLDDGGTTFDLGDKRLDLRTAAAAATELAQVVERARARHLELVSQGS